MSHRETQAIGQLLCKIVKKAKICRCRLLVPELEPSPSSSHSTATGDMEAIAGPIYLDSTPVLSPESVVLQFRVAASPAIGAMEPIAGKKEGTYELVPWSGTWARTGRTFVPDGQNTEAATDPLLLTYTGRMIPPMALDLDHSEWLCPCNDDGRMAVEAPSAFSSQSKTAVQCPKCRGFVNVVDIVNVVDALESHMLRCARKRPTCFHCLQEMIPRKGDLHLGGRCVGAGRVGDCFLGMSCRCGAGRGLQQRRNDFCELSGNMAGENAKFRVTIVDEFWNLGMGVISVVYFKFFYRS